MRVQASAGVLGGCPAPLVRTSTAWVAVFPTLTFPCGEEPGGQRIYWRQRSVIELHFTQAGLAAIGVEGDVAGSPRCGYWASRRLWSARYVGVG